MLGLMMFKNTPVIEALADRRVTKNLRAVYVLQTKQGGKKKKK